MNQNYIASSKESLPSKASQHLAKYIIESQIGRGASGVCYKVHHINQKKAFVMKKILVNSYPQSSGSTTNKNNSRLKAALSEVHLLSQLNHPNIIKYYDSFADDQYLYIIMEYAPKGDLHRILKRRKIKGNSYDEKDIWNMMEQILHALSYLHQNNIIHRDVKTLNVMVGSDNNLMLGDLGVSKMVQNELALYSRVGTPLYLAPEIIKYEKYDFKADVWGAGCIAYILATLTHPFEGKNIISLGQNIVSIQPKHINYFLGSTSCTKYSQQLNSFILEMLEKDPSKRPSVDNLLKKYFSFQKEKPKRTDKLLVINKQVKNQDNNTNFSFDQSKQSLLESSQSPISKRKLTNGIRNYQNETIKIANTKKVQNQDIISNVINSQASIEQKVKIQQDSRDKSFFDNRKIVQKSRLSQVKYVQIDSKKSISVQRLDKVEAPVFKQKLNNDAIREQCKLQQKVAKMHTNQTVNQSKQKGAVKRPITAFRNNYISMMKPEKEFKSSTNVNKINVLIDQNYVGLKQGVHHKAGLSYQLKKQKKDKSSDIRQRVNSQFEENTVIKPSTRKNYNQSGLNRNQQITHIDSRQNYMQKESQSIMKNPNGSNVQQYKNNQLQKGNSISALYSLRNRHFYHTRAKNNDSNKNIKRSFQNQLYFSPDQVIYDPIEDNMCKDKKWIGIIEDQSKLLQKKPLRSIHSSQQKIKQLGQMSKKNLISMKNVISSHISQVIKTEHKQISNKDDFILTNNKVNRTGKDTLSRNKQKIQQKLIKVIQNSNIQDISSNMKRLKSSQNYFECRKLQIAQEKECQFRKSQLAQDMKTKAQIKYYRPRPQTSINRKCSMIKDVKRKKVDQSSNLKYQAVQTQMLKKPQVILL